MYPLHALPGRRAVHNGDHAAHGVSPRSLMSPILVLPLGCTLALGWAAPRPSLGWPSRCCRRRGDARRGRGLNQFPSSLTPCQKRCHLAWYEAGQRRAYPTTLDRRRALP